MKNIDELRQHAIDTIIKLRAREIDTTEAGVTAKLYESVVSSIKVELEYARLNGVEPNVKFLETPRLLGNDDDNNN